MSFPKRQATIEPYEHETAKAGQVTLTVTANGKFCAGTVHDSEQAAREYAKRKRIPIIEK